MLIKLITYSAVSVLAALLVCVSCKPKAKDPLPKRSHPLDTIGVKYYFDTTKYQLHNSGFYLSKSGDIFQLNRVTFDDSAGIWTTYYWLDSLMFFGEYPNQTPLRKVIDLETFISDSLSNFEKDKNHVYFARATSDGVYRFIVEKANPKTFRSIRERWGKDQSHVFYETDIVKGADLRSFQILNDRDSAKDKNHVYYLGKKVKRAKISAT